MGPPVPLTANVIIVMHCFFHMKATGTAMFLGSGKTYFTANIPHLVPSATCQRLVASGNPLFLETMYTVGREQMLRH